MVGNAIIAHIQTLEVLDKCVSLEKCVQAFVPHTGSHQIQLLSLDILGNTHVACPLFLNGVSSQFDSR